MRILRTSDGVRLLLASRRLGCNGGYLQRWQAVAVMRTLSTLERSAASSAFVGAYADSLINAPRCLCAFIGALVRPDCFSPVVACFWCVVCRLALSLVLWWRWLPSRIGARALNFASGGFLPLGVYSHMVKWLSCDCRRF